MLAGIDGCPNAWIAVTQDDQGVIDSHHITNLEAFLDQHKPKIVAIDIPIGLVESGSRTCDVEARKLLGIRKSSVFPAPILPAIAARGRQAAHDISMSIHDKGVGSQSFGIYAKVKEVDDLVHARPDLRECIYEIHPELSSYAWNGDRPMSNPKRTGPGFMERIALVESVFGPNAFNQVRANHRRTRVADDDISTRSPRYGPRAELPLEPRSLARPRPKPAPPVSAWRCGADRPSPSQGGGLFLLLIFVHYGRFTVAHSKAQESTKMN